MREVLLCYVMGRLLPPGESEFVDGDVVDA